MPLRAPRSTSSVGSTRSYGGFGLIAAVREEQAALLDLFGWIVGRTPNFSLGNRNLPVFIPRGGVSEIPTTPTGSQTVEVPPQIDRRDIPPIQEGVQDMSVWYVSGRESEADLQGLIAAGVTLDYSKMQVVAPPPPPPPAPAPAPAPTTTTRTETEMDLGTLATDLLREAGTAYIRREFAPEGPQIYSSGPRLTNALTDVVDVPFVDVIPEAPGATCGKGSPVYKKVCGQYKWVYPKRRRRKQLVTQSDIKGLAALKGVIGQGKLLETWIATHS